MKKFRWKILGAYFSVLNSMICDCCLAITHMKESGFTDPPPSASVQGLLLRLKVLHDTLSESIVT